MSAIELSAPADAQNVRKKPLHRSVVTSFQPSFSGSYNAAPVRSGGIAPMPISD